MLFGVPSNHASGGSVPWYQQPIYTGNNLPPSSALFGGGAPAAPRCAVEQKEQQKGGLAGGVGEGAAAGGEMLYCDACEKDFTHESQYRAHVATHVTCSAPDCSFVGSQRVVKEHMQMVHGQSRGGKKGGKDGDVPAVPMVSLNTPEEIAQWREARAKNWPSDSNIARKMEQEVQRQARGQPDAPKKGRFGDRGPQWQMKPTAASNTTSKRHQPLQRGGQGARGGQATCSAASESAAPTRTVAQQQGYPETAKGNGISADQRDAGGGSDLFGLGCYESDDEDEGAPDEHSTSGVRRVGAAEAAAGVAVEAMEEDGEGGGMEEDKGLGRRQDNRQQQRQRQPQQGRKQHSSGEKDAGDGGDRGRKSRKVDKYVGYGRIERKGGSLLNKLLKEDKHRQDAMLLQVIRHMAVEYSGD